MINVTIGNETRLYQDIDPQWINMQINRRRESGESVCVRVNIDESDCKILLSTPTCGGGGGARKPTEKEANIIQLWDQLRLNNEEFTGGNVVAFLEQLPNHL